MALVAFAFFAENAHAQLKDCFDVYEDAQQSRVEALQACCTGTFNTNKRNSQGWVWHEELHLYVDESKCDRVELRRILIEKLKKEKPTVSGTRKPPGDNTKRGTSTKGKSISALPWDIWAER